MLAHLKTVERKSRYIFIYHVWLSREKVRAYRPPSLVIKRWPKKCSGKQSKQTAAFFYWEHHNNNHQFIVLARTVRNWAPRLSLYCCIVAVLHLYCVCILYLLCCICIVAVEAKHLFVFSSHSSTWPRHRSQNVNTFGWCWSSLSPLSLSSLSL